jgi:hypothetical protein
MFSVLPTLLHLHCRKKADIGRASGYKHRSSAASRGKLRDPPVKPLPPEAREERLAVCRRTEARCRFSANNVRACASSFRRRCSRSKRTAGRGIVGKVAHRHLGAGSRLVEFPVALQPFSRPGCMSPARRHLLHAQARDFGQGSTQRLLGCCGFDRFGPRGGVSRGDGS